jgi:hypothetical protein
MTTLDFVLRVLAIEALVVWQGVELLMGDW